MKKINIFFLSVACLLLGLNIFSINGRASETKAEINVQKFDGKQLKVVSTLNGKSVLDMDPNNINTIHLWEGAAVSQQRWNFKLDKSSDSYTIENSHVNAKGKYLSETSDNKLNLISSITNNARWKVVQVKISSTGFVYEIVNYATGNRLDVDYAGTANGTPVVTYKKTNTANQYWDLDELILDSTGNPVITGQAYKIELKTTTGKTAYFSTSRYTDRVWLAPSLSTDRNFRLDRGDEPTGKEVVAEKNYQLYALWGPEPGFLTKQNTSIFYPHGGAFVQGSRNDAMSISYNTAEDGYNHHNMGLIYRSGMSDIVVSGSGGEEFVIKFIY